MKMIWFHLILIVSILTQPAFSFSFSLSRFIFPSKQSTTFSSMWSGFFFDQTPTASSTPPTTKIAGFHNNDVDVLSKAIETMTTLPGQHNNIPPLNDTLRAVFTNRSIVLAGKVNAAINSTNDYHRYNALECLTEDFCWSMRILAENVNNNANRSEIDYIAGHLRTLAKSYAGLIKQERNATMKKLIEGCRTNSKVEASCFANVQQEAITTTTTTPTPTTEATPTMEMNTPYAFDYETAKEYYLDYVHISDEHRHLKTLINQIQTELTNFLKEKTQESIVDDQDDDYHHGRHQQSVRLLRSHRSPQDNSFDLAQELEEQIQRLHQRLKPIEDQMQELLPSLREWSRQQQANFDWLRTQAPKVIRSFAGRVHPSRLARTHRWLFVYPQQLHIRV